MTIGNIVTTPDGRWGQIVNPLDYGWAIEGFPLRSFPPGYVLVQFHDWDIPQWVKTTQLKVTL
jgi:hypothetical protein